MAHAESIRDAATKETAKVSDITLCSVGLWGSLFIPSFVRSFVTLAQCQVVCGDVLVGTNPKKLGREGAIPNVMQPPPEMICFGIGSGHTPFLLFYLLLKA